MSAYVFVARAAVSAIPCTFVVSASCVATALSAYAFVANKAVSAIP